MRHTPDTASCVKYGFDGSWAELCLLQFNLESSIMKANRSAARSVPVAVVSLVLAAVAGAQPTPETKISIEASRVVITQGKYSRTGTEDTATLSRTVPYGDLDLGTPQGAHALESRIDDAATAVCTELGKRFPDGSVAAEIAHRNACIKEAVVGGMKQARVAIASAEAAKRR
jgi:UrcA family protein